MITTFPSALKEAIRAELLDVHTSIPGTIESFDPEKQTVEVQINIKLGRQVQGSIVTEPITILKDVPICYPRANDYSITFPIQKGDTCELRFMERSLDNWLLDGGVVDSEDYRHHSLSDAIAYVGLWDRTNLIKEYNPDQPEFRTGDAKRKVWLDDNKDTGHVEMVDLDNDSRVVLKANGEARMANDKIKTFVEIHPDTKILIKNPLARVRIKRDGDILMKNPLISRRMDKLGDIKDKTILGKSYLKKTGEQYFKNIIAKKVTSASGEIKYRTLLNSFSMSPSGITKIGNPLNKLKINPLSSSLGSLINKLSVSPIRSSLGNPVASLQVLPTSVILKDVSGVVTPSIMTAVVSTLTAIVSAAGLPAALLTSLLSEITSVEDIISNLPLDEEDNDDEDLSVTEQIVETLIDIGVDPESDTGVSILELSATLDNTWDDAVFEEMINMINEVSNG